jgi:pimeloyl-ACP methyl ester carboxylesterase
MKVRVGDVGLYFDVDGPKFESPRDGGAERPTVVLLHTGPGGDHSLFKDSVGPQLAAVAQVVYLDLRGHGRSDRSVSASWNLATWREDLAAFLDVLEIERPVLLGVAIGAMVALSFAAHHPDRVRRLVLSSANARYVPSRSVAVFDRLSPGAGDVATAYLADPTEATFTEYLRVCVPLYMQTPLPAEIVARMEVNMEVSPHWQRAEAKRLDLREEAGRVGCPVLVIAGEDDPAFPVTGAQELVASLPEHLVRFERFPNAGHGVFRDAPEAISLVREFVRAAGEPEGEAP